jgi:putative transposase
MYKKEYYRGNLPHFQLPGQWYFITCVLQNVAPNQALKNYSRKMKVALFRCKNFQDDNLNPCEILKSKRDYQILKKRYFFCFDKLLNKSYTGQITLNDGNNRKIIEDALRFWENKRLYSHAWCIMPNHFHWVVSIFRKNENGEPVYLQDILHSIKSYTAHQINKNESTTGQLWMHESFETTIRNEKHFMNVINYTVNNPVKAGLVKNWLEWSGTYLEEEL